MATIQPTEQTARWLIESLEVDGQTSVGQLTGVNPVFDSALIWAEGDEAFLTAAHGNVSNYNPIPAVGEWCEAGKIYGYGGGLVICRQDHYRTIYPPEDTLALWIVYREDAGVLDWIAGEQVNIGDLRTYKGVTYRCIQAHVTQKDWTPLATLNVLWQVYEEPVQTDEWQPYTAYKIGDIVTYLGIEYSCRQSHNSLPGWEPPNVPALWLKI